MKLQFIISVVVFFLCTAATTVIDGERNGPTNTHVYAFSSSRGRSTEMLGEGFQDRRNSGSELMMNVNNESPVPTINWKRRLSSNVLKITNAGFSRSDPIIMRLIKRKFPRITTAPKIGFTSTTTTTTMNEYEKNKNSRVRAVDRKYLRKKFHHARRSIDLGIDFSDHHSESDANPEAIFLEPVIHKNRKKSFFGYSLDFADSDSHSYPRLGPQIGPLNFPGLGENVYIRLMVPPDEESSSHVTVRLVGSHQPVEKFEGQELFPVAHVKSLKPAPAPRLKPLESIIKPNKFVNFLSGPFDPRESRFVGKSAVESFGFVPTRTETFQLFRDSNKYSNEMRNRRPTRFGNPSQYLAAPNHHRLPIVIRQSSDNSIDLPIYPPLSTVSAINESSKDESENREKNKNTHKVLNHEGKRDSDNLDDAEESESSKHTFVSHKDSDFGINSQSAGDWKSEVRFLTFNEPQEVIENQRKSTEPIFIEEIEAPDLGAYDYNSSDVDKAADNGSTGFENQPKDKKDEKKVGDKIPVISENLRTVKSSSDER